VTSTNRDWLTLAFGIGLVTAVVGLSLRQNVQWRAGAAEPVADAAAPAAPAADQPAAPAGAADAQPAEVPATQPAETRTASAATRKAPFDVSVPVVHKHRFGSCEGMLRATDGGLVFASPNRDDSFQLPFRDIDRFDVTAGTLSVRRRGGRTWNFNGQNDRADALVGFHRAVERARK
jgi:hypothetical protein